MTEEMHKALSELFDKGYEVGYKKAKEDFERPHGEWIKNAESWDYDNPPYICSECGNSHLRKTPFCDICGADMRKEGEAE